MENFQIYPIQLAQGQLAVSPMPGRGGSFDADMATLVAWHPDLVLTLTTTTELQAGNAGTLPRRLKQAGIDWHHLPTEDLGIPQGQTETNWPATSAKARAILANGGRVLAHCKGGNGRSGMAALRLMIEIGAQAETALADLRKVRAKAVETEAQMGWAFGRDGI